MSLGAAAVFWLSGFAVLIMAFFVMLVGVRFLGKWYNDEENVTRGTFFLFMTFIIYELAIFWIWVYCWVTG